MSAKRSLHLLLLILLLVLVACSQNDNHGAANEQPPAQGSSNTEQPADDEDNDGEVDGEGADEEQVMDDEILDEEQAEEEPESIDITYYMNGIYDIKPIDPDGDDHVVLLTFDDGPKEEDLVKEMLDVLDKHEAKAIFFVNGHRVKSNPELLVDIHERGQIIGNHTWQHFNLTELTNEEIDHEIEEVQRIVEELIGEKPLFFRPPFGAGNDYVRDKVAEEGMLYMHWSNGSLDWDVNYRTTETILGSILDQLRPGSNILMHELQWTVEALDTILTTLSEAGYSFVDPRAIHLEQGNPIEANQLSE